MRRITSALCAAALACGATAFGTQQTAAQPFAAAAQLQPGHVPHVLDVRGHRRGDAGRGFERRGDRAYYRGYRGERHQRPGWRQHQGWWFPPAAFALGLFAMPSAQPTGRVLSHAHVNWCRDRYRSYRVRDNTFQPYRGPRRECRSPFG